MGAFTAPWCSTSLRMWGKDCHNDTPLATKMQPRQSCMLIGILQFLAWCWIARDTTALVGLFKDNIERHVSLWVLFDDLVTRAMGLRGLQVLSPITVAFVVVTAQLIIDFHDITWGSCHYGILLPNWLVDVSEPQSIFWCQTRKLRQWGSLQAMIPSWATRSLAMKWNDLLHVIGQPNTFFKDNIAQVQYCLLLVLPFDHEQVSTSRTFDSNGEPCGFQFFQALSLYICIWFCFTKDLEGIDHVSKSFMPALHPICSKKRCNL